MTNLPDAGADKRFNTRLLVVGTCELLMLAERPPRTASAPLVNASRGGLCVACDPPYPVGTLVRVRSLATGGRTWLLGSDARVAWAREKDPAIPREPAAVGLTFVALTPAAQTILEAFVRTIGG